MRQISGLLWLLIVDLRGRRKRPLSTTVLVIGSALLAFLFLSTFGVPHVANVQSDRRFALTPQVGSHVSPEHRDGLLTLDPNLVADRRWDEHQIVRRYFAGTGTSLSIPGAATVPEPGQYYASPGLRKLMNSDPTIAALFDGLDDIGTVTPSGLVQPQELRAIIGIDKNEPLLVPVESFGADPDGGLSGDNGLLDAAVALVVALTVWLPSIAFLIIICRLASRQRQTQVRSLRLLGMSRIATRVLQGASTASVAFVGSVTGCVLYLVWVSVITEVPGTSFGYAPADARLGLLMNAATVVVVVGAAGIVAGFGSAMASGDLPATRPPAGKWSTSGMVVLFAGLAYLLGAPLAANVIGTGPAAIGFWAASGLVAVGLALAGPRLVIALANRGAVRARSSQALVGMRIAGWSTTTVSRLGSVFSVTIVLMLSSMSFIAILNGGSSSSFAEALDARTKIPLVATDITGTVPRREVVSAHSGGLVQSIEATFDGRRRLVVYASCRDLSDTAAAEVSSCSGRPQWLVTRKPDRPMTDQVAGNVSLPGGRRVKLPQGADVFVATSLPAELDGALLVPPRFAPITSARDGSTFLLLVDSSDLRITLARLSSRSATMQFAYGPAQRSNPDEQQFPSQLRWLLVGAALSLAAGALALVAAGIGEASERARQLNAPRKLGASRGQLARMHLWATAMPLVLLGWVATGSGWLVCRAMYSFDDRAAVPLSAVGLTALLVPCAAMLIAATTTPDAIRATGTPAG